MRDDPSNTNVAASYPAAELKCKKLLRKFEIKKEHHSKLLCKRGHDALSNSAGGVIVGEAECTDLLNSYFSLVCTTDNKMPMFNRSVLDGVELDFAEFTPGKVRYAIKKLKAYGCCGPDGQRHWLSKGKLID